TRLAHRGEVVERPAQLARAVVRGKEEPGLAMDRFALRLEAREPLVHAPVLPTEERREGPTVAAIPAGRARALAREPRRGDIMRARAEACERIADRSEHLLAVLLGAIRLRMREPDGAFAPRDHAAGTVDHDRAARMRALVDGEVQRRAIHESRKRSAFSIARSRGIPRKCGLRKMACVRGFATSSSSRAAGRARARASRSRWRGTPAS